MALLKFVAQLKDHEAQEFLNPYDAMSAMLGVEGECDIYVETDDGREALMHRDSHGVWSEA